MITIAVVNQKGGVGKTSLATNIAACAHLEGLRTLVVDMDQQGSALDWSAARGERSKLAGLVVVKADKALAVPRFREMSRGFDVIVLDCPPRLGDITRSAACAADVAAIPVRPSALDLWAASSTLELLDGADAIRAELGRPPLRRMFIVNSASRGTVLARQAPQALEEHGEVAGVIGQRIAFPEATACGESVLTTDPDGAAAFEIRRLWRALRREAA